MQWTYLALALALYAQDAFGAATPFVPDKRQSVALMRFECSQLVIERLDPLVQPGLVPSTHLHQIAGGNSFNASMPGVAYDPSKLATCTSCTFNQDFSNYWTASLYFKARNGTFKRVPQLTNLGLKGKNGGLTVYYIPPYDGKSKVTAPPTGFRMIVGDPMLRSGTNMQRQLCHRCETNVAQNPFGGAPCTGSDTGALPKATCGGGIRATITFPTCWDGKNLDSADHKSHVAYPSSGTFESTGPCPTTHPVHLPQIMYEVIWDTREFNDKSIWPADGSQPFVYSMGDGTGYGWHGDYLFGWKDGVLQKALDARCSGDTCTALTTQTAAQANACMKSQQAVEQTEGWLTSLPGNLPVTYQ